MKKHSKHVKIPKPDIDNFSALDIGLIGLDSNFNTYASNALPKLSSQNGILVFKDVTNNICINSKSVKSVNKNNLQDYDYKLFAESHTFALINAQQLKVKKVIVFFDNIKTNQLQEIKSESKIIAIIGKDPIDIKSKLKTQNLEELSSKVSQECNFVEIINNVISENIPQLKGLVLSGGKSSRMGKDKSQLTYFDCTAEYYTKHLLEEAGIETWLSKAKKSDIENQKNSNTIYDTFLDAGPLGAICSGFKILRNNALLVIACDLPLINLNLIKSLIAKRNPDKFATCIKSKMKDFPEPLITIYEPKSYSRLLNFMAIGYSCPRKMLINSEVEIVEIENDCIITNVNTPEEYTNVLARIAEQNKIN